MPLADGLCLGHSSPWSLKRRLGHSVKEFRVFFLNCGRVNAQTPTNYSQLSLNMTLGFKPQVAFDQRQVLIALPAFRDHHRLRNAAERIDGFHKIALEV